MQDSDSLQPAVIAVSAICLLLASLATAIRFVVKSGADGIRIEDYLSLMALLIFIVHTVLDPLDLIHLGVGKHHPDPDEENPDPAAKLTWLPPMFWVLNMLIAKTALSLQFKRFFCPTSHGKLHIVNTILMCFNILWLTIAFFVIIFKGIHVYVVWDPTSGTGQSDSEVVGFAVTGALNVFSDICLLIFPLWAIWRLQMRIERKLRFIAVFSIGILACVCSVLRLVYSATLYQFDDLLYNTAKLSITTATEITATIVVTAFPFMPAFGKAFAAKCRSLIKTYRSSIKELDSDEEATRPSGHRHPQTSSVSPRLHTQQLTSPTLSLNGSFGTQMGTRVTT